MLWPTWAFQVSRDWSGKTCGEFEILRAIVSYAGRLSGPTILPRRRQVSLDNPSRGSLRTFRPLYIAGLHVPRFFCCSPFPAGTPPGAKKRGVATERTVKSARSCSGWVAGVGSNLERALEPPNRARSAPIGDPRIDERRLNPPMSEMILDAVELTGVEKVSGDRVAHEVNVALGWR
jgi:hypothetical protein